MEKEIMKKVLMVLLGAMLILSMSGMVSADIEVIPGEGFNTSGDSVVHSVPVTVGLDQSFTVTIPSAINLDDTVQTGTYSGYDTLSATVHLLNPQTKLVVTISSDNSSIGDNLWNLTSTTDSSKKVKYIIAETGSSSVHIDENAPGNWLENGEAVLTLTGPTATPMVKHLHFKIKDGQFSSVEPGQYSDTLKFTVSLVSTAP